MNETLPMANGISLLAVSLIYKGTVRIEREDDMTEKSVVLYPEVNAADHFDAQSKTCGIAEAIAVLPASGGRVRLPAGTYLLRDSVYVPSRVSLVGDGPATVLAIRPLQVAKLAQNVRKGQRVFECRGKPLLQVGDGIGVKDDRRGGWHGTHAVVQKIEGKRVWLDVPFYMGLSTADHARVVNLFPAIYALDEEDVEIRDLTLQGPDNYRGEWWDFTYAGMHLVGCRRVRILNCTIKNWPSDGIGVQRGSDVQVAQCQAHGCRGHGFHPGTGLARSVWSHNIGHKNGVDGFFFCARVHHSTCSDSAFSENGRHGIGGVAEGGDHHNIVDSNVCAHNDQCGIDASRGTEQVITGNVLLGNSRGKPGRFPGIRLRDLTHAIVQGNRCADDGARVTQTGGIIESGASDYNLISGNLCAGMAEAVVVCGRHSRAEGNLV